MFKYDRSAAGAKEAVTIENCGIVVEINDTFVKMIDKLEFELDEYGAYFDGDKSENTRKEYKAKVSLYNKVQKGDNVVVYYNKGIGTITGEGKDAEAVKSLVVALIDTDEAVGYYKELADNKEEYQPLFDKENSSNGDPVNPPAGDEGNTGTGNEGTTPGSTIFDEEKEITWSEFLIIESNKFDGETPKTISIYYDCPKESEYVAMKIAANYENAALGDGTIEGGNFKTDDKGAIEAMGNPSDTGKVVSYKPTDNEWNIITKSGFYINGNGVKITKVTLK